MTRLVAFGSVLLFCAVGVVQILRLVRHPDFFLGVFPDGVGHLGSAVSWFLPWPVLTGVGLDEVLHRGGRTVFLRFDVRERIPIDGAPPLRWMHTLPRRDRDAALTVPVHVLLAPPDRVIATIQRCQADEAARATLDALAEPPPGLDRGARVATGPARRASTAGGREEPATRGSECACRWS